MPGLCIIMWQQIRLLIGPSKRRNAFPVGAGSWWMERRNGASSDSFVYVSPSLFCFFQSLVSFPYKVVFLVFCQARLASILHPSLSPCPSPLSVSPPSLHLSLSDAFVPHAVKWCWRGSRTWNLRWYPASHDYLILLFNSFVFHLAPIALNCLLPKCMDKHTCTSCKSYSGNSANYRASWSPNRKRQLYKWK